MTLKSALLKTVAKLKQAAVAIDERVPHEMLLDLYRALAAVDELTVKTTADYILNRIFSSFWHREVRTISQAGPLCQKSENRSQYFR